MTFQEITDRLTLVTTRQKSLLRKVALTRAKATHDRTDARCVQCGVKLQANYRWYKGLEQPPIADRELQYNLRGVQGSGAFHSKTCAMEWAIEMAELAEQEHVCRELLAILIEEGGE